MSFAESIKEFALDLGYSRVGVTTTEGFPDYAVELESRREMYSFYVDGRRKPLEAAFPARIVPNARSIIMMSPDYAKEAFPENLVGKRGRLYQAR